MAWTSVDFTKCLVRTWRAGIYTVGASSIAAVNQATLADDFFCVRELPTAKNTDSDWSIRGEYTLTGTDSWWAGGVVAMVSKPGSMADWYTHGGADDFCVNIVCLDTTGGNVYRFGIRCWTGAAEESLWGSNTITLGTKYYFTVEYDADGGAAGVARVTVTVRTGSHTGSVFETITKDLSGSGASFDVDLAYAMFQQALGLYGGLNRGDPTLETVEVDFTIGSEDQSGDSGANLGSKQTRDYTSLSASQTPTRFTVGADLLENIGTAHGDFRKDTDDVWVYEDLVTAPSGAFTAWEETRFDALEDWYTHGGAPGLSSALKAYKTLITDNDDFVGLMPWSDGSNNWVIYLGEINAGSETITAGTVALGYNIHHFLTLKYDPAVGTYGTIYGYAQWGHWDALRVLDSISQALTQTPSSAAVRYWMASQTYHNALGSGDRLMGIDHRSLWATWLENEIAVSGADTVEFGETAERYSVAAAKEETVALGESGSEVATLNVDAPTEGVTFAEAAGLIQEVSAQDALELGEKASRAFDVAGADQVEFSEEAKRLSYAEEGATFAEVGSSVLVIQVEAVDGLTFQEGAAHLPIEGCETGFSPDPAILADPASVTHVFLLGPWATMDYVMRLPRPSFGDVRRSRLQVVVHRTRGGQRRVYKRTPTYRSQLLTFRGLTRKKLLELEYFLEHTAGEDIRYIDHEGRVWRGNVLTAPSDLTHEGPDDGEAVLEFEGETVTA